MALCPIIHRVNVASPLEIVDPFNRDDNWNEISGTAISPTQIAPSGFPVIFGHNDGPNSKMVFAAWDSGTGKRLKTINLLAANKNNFPLFHKDWEDMTIGKCSPNTNDSCIYLADTGDNIAQDNGSVTQREGMPYTIYKIREPRLSEIPDNAVLRAEDYIQVLHFDYRHSSSPTPYANCEAIFLDHKGWGGEVGDLYLVTKWNQDKSRRLNRLFKIPPSAWPNSFGQVRSYRPFVVGEYSGNSGGSFYSYEWTGADMALDGTKIALTWKGETHVFPRCPGESVANAIARRELSSCVQYVNPPEGANPGNQYEAVSFAPDGNRLFNLAESLDPPRIIQVDLLYSNGRFAGRRCSRPPDPTPRPTRPPTRPPTRNPTPPPTRAPTPRPTPSPTPLPTKEPTETPSDRPSEFPSSLPSLSPSVVPSDLPSVVPSDMPSVVPSVTPTKRPSRPPQTLLLEDFGNDGDDLRLSEQGTFSQLSSSSSATVAGPHNGMQMIFLFALILMLVLLR